MDNQEIVDKLMALSKEIGKGYPTVVLLILSGAILADTERELAGLVVTWAEKDKARLRNKLSAQQN